MSAFPEGRLVQCGAVKLEVFEAAADAPGTPVVLCHGFPELAFSWRHQLAALGAAGVRAIAPNQRGYGGSSKPAAVGDYGLRQLTDDLAALLDALQVEKAVFAGHDWGGFVAWAMPLLHPQRCAGVIGVNTPYAPFPKTEVLGKMFDSPDKLYITWFQKPGVAEAVLDKDVRAVFTKLMRRGAKPAVANMREAPDANPFRRLAEMQPRGEALLNEAELQSYCDAFAAGGFRGPINWYRNIDANADAFPQIGVQKLALPCLMVCAEWDAALPPAMAAGMPKLCSNLEMHTLPECGHWTQQEKPERLNGILLAWLRRHGFAQSA